MSTSIWDKIDETVIEAARPGTATTPTEPKPNETLQRWKQKNWQRIFRIGDIAGTLIWVIGIVKLFVFDFDRYLVDRFAPSLSILVDFRFFLILGIAALLAAVSQQSIFLLVYVALFPFVVVLWKTPRLLYRFHSWNLLLALLSTIQSFCHRFRRNFLLRVIELLAALLVVATTARAIIAPSVVILTLALLYHYAAAIRSAVKAPRFLTTQQHLVKRFVNSKWFESIFCVSKDLRSDEVQTFDTGQLTRFINEVSAGLLALKALEFYAFLLRKYRRSNAGLVFGIASFAWLLLQSIVFLTLANYGVWKLSPREFAVTDLGLSILDFVYYSLTALYCNAIPQLSADGDLAVGVAIFACVYGPVLLLTLALQLVFGYRQSRDDAKFSETISSIRSSERALAVRLEEEYEVSPEEALNRLHDVDLGASALLVYLATRFPSKPRIE